MAEELPLRPVSRQDIHRLEAALLIATLFRPDVLEEIQKAEERLTWVDSLAVAAAALAREKAGMPISQIAEEVGRTETTIRNHLKGKTKAGQLVRETYERFVREGFKLELPQVLVKAVGVSPEEVARLKSELEEATKKVKELEAKVAELSKERDELASRVSVLEEKLRKIKEIIES